MTLTAAEKTFIARMAFHAAKGLSFEEAARAVIEDDQRIFAAVAGNDEIREQMAATVYANIRGAA